MRLDWLPDTGCEAAARAGANDIPSIPEPTPPARWVVVVSDDALVARRAGAGEDLVRLGWLRDYAAPRLARFLGTLDAMGVERGSDERAALIRAFLADDEKTQHGTNTSDETAETA